MRKFPQYKSPVKLNLGCAGKWPEGVINIDNEDYGQDMVWDVTDGLPFPDNSVEEIQTSHMIEHLDDDQSLDLLKEAFRVLKKGGCFICLTPHIHQPTAIYFGHKSFWNEAKIDALMRIHPKIGEFEIVQNIKMDDGLLFRLRKIK